MFSAIILICNVTNNSCDHRLLTPMFPSKEVCDTYAEKSIETAVEKFNPPNLVFDYQCVSWESA